MKRICVFCGSAEGKMLTWVQLGISPKPVGLLNVRGYWDALLAQLAHAAREGFIRPEHLALVLTAGTSAELLDRLSAPPLLSARAGERLVG